MRKKQKAAKFAGVDTVQEAPGPGTSSEGKTTPWTADGYDRENVKVLVPKHEPVEAPAHGREPAELY